ncbi:MAG: ATP-dependent Clp protease adaptor ClpS [Treponema sp.]|nr:ATP-dependent Clp protease adaptor ClpS [Treponema sp.]MCI6892095.1 ATP-dependent Clp protease adaptor ClpS [Treponema sp.]MCI7566591.1 ATP-dependent Clp protease adaptor ClpS [Treponema sp.]
MSDTSNQSEGLGNGLAEDTSFELPPERKVVFYNDDFTTMDFVVDILISVFNKSHDEAENIMLQVHENGSSVVGVYTYDIAISRTTLTIQLARKNNFPLRVEVE